MPISAAHLYDYVHCPERVYLDYFGTPQARDPVSPFVQMLWERGTLYEKEVMAGQGISVTDLSHLAGDTKTQATLEAMAHGDTYIYAGRLEAGDLLGAPDLLHRSGNGYVAIDIKSGRGLEGSTDTSDGTPKKHYAVQLALYQDLLEQLGYAGERCGYIWDIDGEEIPYPFDTPYGQRAPKTLWQTYQAVLAEVRSIAEGKLHPQPAYASQCKQCVWYSHCKSVLKASDDLTLIPNLGRSRRDVIAPQASTIHELATTDPQMLGDNGRLPGIGAKTLQDFHKRAQLLATPGAQAYAEQPLTFPQVERELFFDIETDPLRGICYLHGFVERQHGDNSTEQYHGFFAETPDAEGEVDAFARAMAFIQSRQPCAIYYYSKYERTLYRQLQARYPNICSQETIEALFGSELTIDLLSNGVEAGTYWPSHDHSIKSLARYLGFEWRDDDASCGATINLRTARQSR